MVYMTIRFSPFADRGCVVWLVSSSGVGRLLRGRDQASMRLLADSRMQALTKVLTARGVAVMNISQLRYAVLRRCAETSARVAAPTPES